jgi:hypothetical protein
MKPRKRTHRLRYGRLRSGALWTVGFFLLVLTRLPGASWIRSARLLARLEDVRVDPTTDKQIIMMCDQAYDNVPRRMFGRAPLTQAVAYSTGETDLITLEEFARLDLRGLIDLQALGETHLVEQCARSAIHFDL